MVNISKIIKRIIIDKKINPSSKDNELLCNYIDLFAQKHALDLYEKLFISCKKEFKNLDSKYPWWVLILSLKTHLGENNDFWYPLFKSVTGHNPMTAKKEDDLVWDVIIPFGYKSLQRIEKRIVLSHEGDFVYPLPKLYKETQ